MENGTKELFFIGNTEDGKKVYDSPESNWKNGHQIVSLELLVEGIKKINTQNRKEKCVETIDFGRVIGKTYCVEIEEYETTYSVMRKGRSGLSPIVINRPPEDSTKLTVILLPAENDTYTLLTTYIGDVCLREPWDKTLIDENNAEEIEASKLFWSNHALVYDSTTAEHIEINGQRFTPKEFEDSYVHNVDRYKLDVSENTLVMMAGIPTEGKSKKLKGFINQLEDAGIECVLVDYNEIRIEKFNNKKMSDEEKTEVYAEIVSRVKENIEKNLVVIVDAPFVEDWGKNARVELYKLAKNRKLPLRAYAMKINTDIIEKTGLVNKVDMENVVKMNEVYDTIIDKEIPRVCGAKGTKLFISADKQMDKVG